MRVAHAERGSVAVHVAGKRLDGAGDALGDRDRDVVGRFDHQHLQRIAERYLRAGGKAHMRRRHLVRAGGHLERRVEGDFVVAHRRKRDVDGHQLGRRGGKPVLGGVLRIEDVAGREVHREGRRRPCRRQAERGEAKEGDADATKHPRDRSRLSWRHRPSTWPGRPSSAPASWQRLCAAAPASWPRPSCPWGQPASRLSHAPRRAACLSRSSWQAPRLGPHPSPSPPASTLVFGASAAAFMPTRPRWGTRASLARRPRSGSAVGSTCSGEAPARGCVAGAA